MRRVWSYRYQGVSERAQLEVQRRLEDFAIGYNHVTRGVIIYNPVKKLSRMLIRAKPGIYTLYGRYGGTDVW